MNSYLRFAAMVGTSTALMYGLMYLNTYRWSDVLFSETRVYMALLMGAVMAIVMLSFMTKMYANKRVNTGIFGGPGVRQLSPLRAFLGRWGLTNAHLDPLIDALHTGTGRRTRSSPSRDRWPCLIRVPKSVNHPGPVGIPVSVGRIVARAGVVWWATISDERDGAERIVGRQTSTLSAPNVSAMIVAASVNVARKSTELISRSRCNEAR